MTSLKFTFDKPASMEEILPLRNEYLDGLLKSQEYYVELEVQAANPYLVLINSKPAGYFYLSDKNALWEYFISHAWIQHQDTIFGKAIHQFGVKTAWCKSFDHDLLTCCATYQKSVQVKGILFRDYQEKQLPPFPEDVKVRFAEPSDESLVQEVNEEVFDHPDEVPIYIKARQIILFEKKNDLVGFGIFSRCIPNRNDFDIGMLVVEKYRRQGYASQILRFLVDHCQNNGWLPGAGCYVNNIASRKSLEKVGFISRYRLLEFTF